MYNDSCGEFLLSLDGESSIDEIDCYLHSKSASIYQIVPSMIVYPKNEEDIRKTFAWADSQGLSISCRGSGSSRVDASLNSGIILNFSKFLNKVISISQDTVKVEPGITWRELNDYLKAYNKSFLPNPSSRMFCTVGGMAAMNASGENSIKYGDTANNISKISFIMSNGEAVEIENRYYTEEEIHNSNLKEIFKKLIHVFEDSKEIIESEKSDALRNCDGYNIWNSYSENRINLLKIIVGSEGTLGIITNITLNIFDSYENVGVISIGFTELNKKSKKEIIQSVRQYNPSAIEYVDKKVLSLRKKYTPEKVAWIDNDIDEMIFIEFEEYSKDELENKINSIINNLGCSNSNLFVRVSYGFKEFDDVIGIRRGTQGLKNREDQARLAVAVIEDASISQDKIFDFMERLEPFFEKHSISPFIAGHIGIGNLHLYPSFNLNDKDEIEKMEKITEEYTELIKEFNGCITAEHGVGITRVDALSQRYDIRIIEVMKKVKNIFDNKDIFNPGKIVNESKNVGFRKSGSFDTSMIERFEISPKVINILDKCHGCGKCLSFCPSYLTYRDEKYSPRGRIEFLTEILSGKLDFSCVSSENAKKISKTCFNCKLCTDECFDNFDITKVNRVINQMQGYEKLRSLIEDLDEKILQRII